MTTLLLCMLLGAPALAADPPAAPAAEAAPAIRSVVERQLRAFEADDAEAAWEIVAPSLRDRFGTPDNFLRMVREAYRPVYRPKSLHFEEVVSLPTGEMGQWLKVTGPDGKPYRALYLLEQQPDGTWRTTGCLLFEPEPAEPSV